MQATCDPATNCTDDCNSCDVTEDECQDKSPLPATCTTSTNGSGHCVNLQPQSGKLSTCRVRVLAKVFAGGITLAVALGPSLLSFCAWLVTVACLGGWVVGEWLVMGLRPASNLCPFHACSSQGTCTTSTTPSTTSRCDEHNSQCVCPVSNPSCVIVNDMGFCKVKGRGQGLGQEDVAGPTTESRFSSAASSGHGANPCSPKGNAFPSLQSSDVKGQHWFFKHPTSLRCRNPSTHRILASPSAAQVS